MLARWARSERASPSARSRSLGLSCALALATFASLYFARRALGQAQEQIRLGQRQLEQTQREIELSRREVEEAHRPVVVPIIIPGRPNLVPQSVSRGPSDYPLRPWSTSKMLRQIRAIAQTLAPPPEVARPRESPSTPIPQVGPVLKTPLREHALRIQRCGLLDGCAPARSREASQGVRSLQGQ